MNSPAVSLMTSVSFPSAPFVAGETLICCVFSVVANVNTTGSRQFWPFTTIVFDPPRCTVIAGALFAVPLLFVGTAFGGESSET